MKFLEKSQKGSLASLFAHDVARLFYLWHMTLQGKKITLAVSGSIAAYKTPHLVRLLVKAGAEVKVIMTPAAASFVSPLALATVSKNEVLHAVSEGDHWNNHVLLGRWADAMLVAPASANTLAKMANGLCDNLLLAVYLSATCPVMVAPAMDEDMWLHKATKTNLQTLQHHGCEILPVGNGELASGLMGQGRMAEPEEIVAHLSGFFNKQSVAKGKKALVTAGPTYEPLDPVRFIGNHSTGKMGVAIAQSLAAKGFEVHLVLGPGNVAVPANINLKRVNTALEMYQACTESFPAMDVAVMTAAVADYRPETIATEKIKKTHDDALQLTLVKNPDILASLGHSKKDKQLVVGFALETNDETANAQKKLIAKNADMIVLNSLNDEGAGFGHDTNKVSLFYKDGTIKELERAQKTEIAESIVDCILTIMK
ncbi:MAG: bifunctional phosphopantothenoylcysteine decarboxylase/phosphopantothenate--cysteine ligase CoaBC [Edaphocola sp.]